MERIQGGGWLAAGAGLLAAALAATWLGLQPPEARLASAPRGAFSAERALGALRPILDAAGEGTPHPVGSDANRRVREQILTQLRALGLDPEVQAAFACGRYRFCAHLSNVLVRVAGRAAGKAVLLTAHYDSVPAGPGAADDGAGVAIALEVARALVAEPAASDVLLLLDDGEETGLAGAEAFLRHPRAAQVGAAVNLEARGTGGPSLLFETTGGGGLIAGRFARGAPSPVANSLFPAVYRLLPNDTDLTVLAGLGVPGANLAFLGGGIRYHTPRDDLAHLDPRSVQQQGENALGLVRALAEPGLARDRSAEVVFFDVLGLAVVRFPEAWALPLSLLALALALAAVATNLRRGRTTVGRSALGLLAMPLALPAAASAGFLCGRALGLHPLWRPWVAEPAPLVAAFLLSGALGAALAAAVLGGRAGPDGLRAGVRVGLAGGAVALAAGLPGASHLLLAPALAAGAAGLAAALGPGEAGEPLADLAAALAGALVLLPVAWLLYPAIGHGGGFAVAATAALATLPLSPLVGSLRLAARGALAAGLALSTGAAAFGAGALPPADAESPERVVVYFHQDAERGRARILASPDLGRLPDAVRAAANFSTELQDPFPWARLRPSFEAPAVPLPKDGPTLEVEALAREGSRLRVRGRLRSPRGAPEGHVAIPAHVPVLSFAFDGVPVPPAERRVARWFGDWAVFRHLTLPPDGTGIEMVLEAQGPVEIQVADQSPGLPPEGARVAAARPSSAVTAQEGDVTLFTRSLRLDVH